MSEPKAAPRIGIVVVAHFGIAGESLRVVEAILGEPVVQAAAVSIAHTDDPDEIVVKLGRAVKDVDGGKGVLILTDMFGGTPSNVALSLLDPGKVEVLSGFNLPMLLKAATCREGKTLAEIAPFLQKYGADHIHVAGRLLAERQG
jgi:PTS system mannose-specific IIA component